MNKRQKQVLSSQLSDEQKELKWLESVYKQASVDTANRISELQMRKQFEPEHLQTIIYQQKYQEAIQKQIEGTLKSLQKKTYNGITDYMNQCYNSGYTGALYDITGQGIPIITPIDLKQVKKAIEIDSNLSQGLYKRLGEDVDYLKKSIKAEVSRGIVEGKSWNDVAEHIANGMNSPFTVAKNNAMRIARTEGHRVSSSANMDALYDAKSKGADIVKQWDSTLDERTRSSHAKCDGEIRELDEKFSNGLMFPSDPHGSAGEVINCRCTLLQRARWNIDSGFTKQDGFTGELREFENPKSYDEFKEWYFSKENKDYMKYVISLEDKYETSDFKTLLAMMNKGEYEKFTKLQDASPMFKSKETPKADLDSVRKYISEQNDLIKKLKAMKRESLREADYYRLSGESEKREEQLRIASGVDSMVADAEKRIEGQGKILVDNLNETFKANSDNALFVKQILKLDSNTEYKEVLKSDTVKSFDEIISVLGGGDSTGGSCASVGLAYIGQKNGWDVLDFRDGESREWFASKGFKVDLFKSLGVDSIVEDSAKSSLTNAKRILDKCELGKEYYLSAGGHASIIRKVEKDVVSPYTGEITGTKAVVQYLELQSGSTVFPNGWSDFDDDVRDTLKWRFGCSPSGNYYSTVRMTDIDQLKDNNEFRTFLGYINTSGDKQVKGVNGSVK